jgi:pimeloyl-ACP methyl ester carboxylesterase
MSNVTFINHVVFEWAYASSGLYTYNRTVLYLPGLEPVQTKLPFPPSVIALARSLNATLGAVEHRCIGHSQPDGYDFKTHWQYCTIDQALSDLAAIARLLSGVTTLVVVGFGYGGTLAAFFRQKYPQLANGAWAASSPVDIQPFSDKADAHVTEALRSINEDCYLTTFTLLQDINRDVTDDGPAAEKIRQDFGFPPNYSSADVLYEIAEGLVYTTRGNDQWRLLANYCRRLTAPGADKREVLASTFNDTLHRFGLTVSSLDPRAGIPGPDGPDGPDGLMRAYMKCAQIGQMHTAPAFRPLRSEKNTPEWFMAKCKERLDVPFKFNDKANGVYGGLRQGGSATVFTYRQLDMDREVMACQNDTAKERYVLTVPGYAALPDFDGHTAKIEEARKHLQRWLWPPTCEHGERIMNGCKCSVGRSGVNCSDAAIPHNTFKWLATLATAIPTIFVLITSIFAWKTILVDPETARSKPIVL